ncbi:hypothetical protein V8F06_006146 [Rhypophila decipiens]
MATYSRPKQAPAGSVAAAAGGSHEPIAIIGTGCRFAGDVNSPSRLWDLLRNPRDVRQETIPNNRFSCEGFYHPDHTQPGHSNIKQSYVVNQDPYAFDAEFFGIKPVEAKAIDPQLRWLMEVVYEGLESAGVPLEKLRGTDTGVYVGVMCNDYEAMLLRDPLQATPTYMATGTSKSMLSNRLSYFFDWRGPSITLDTACSSSLVALHMAVQALRAGESRVAVACGSNMILGPENYIIESKLNMLSPDGLCKMWDQDANGYARGEGLAAVVIKTLSAALADGDQIECIIRETGLNQDGGTTPGITMPSMSAQTALIRSTYAKAGLDPIGNPEDRPQYFEAHGTGTPAGDPVEAEAISQAFFQDHSPHQKLYVGSIKTVLGHTEGTAGLAGILKASLALQHGVIPPNLHFKSLSKRVAPFYHNLQIVQGKPQQWPATQTARRASVNSFGFGGANAHVVLESCGGERNAGSVEELGPLFTPFVFSANSESSLRALLSAYSSHIDIDQEPDIDAHDLAWTLRKRKSCLPYRAYFSAASRAGLKAQIAETLQHEATKTVGIRARTRREDGRKILGIFTGQGAQFARVGVELIEQSSRARRIFQSLESHLTELPPDDRPLWSLMSELLAPAQSSRINEAAISQPLCTAIQILLVDLLALAGIKFGAVVGHSSGEIAAAYAAGALSARDAMYIAYFRGVYAGLAASPNGHDIRGAMLAVGTSMSDAEELCRDEVFAGRLVVAAGNSSSSVTISGDEDAIAELEDLLQDENKFYRRLRVDRAYHSRHMDSCVTSYMQALRRSGVAALNPKTSSCRWFSSVHDREMILDTEAELNDMYWADNMVQPVLFSHALRTALLSSAGQEFDAVLEIGCHPALQGPATQTIKEAIGTDLPYHGTLVRKTNAVTAMSACLGFLWQHGTSPDLDQYERGMRAENQQVQKHRYSLIKGLPTYQWNHTTKYMTESRFSRRMRLRKDPLHALLGHQTPDSSAHHLQWRHLLRTTDRRHDADAGVGGDSDWLSGHRVQGQIVFPAAGYVAAAIEAARSMSSGTLGSEKVVLIEIRNLVIHQSLALASEKDDTGVEVVVELVDIRPTSEVDKGRLTAKFTYSAAMGKKDDSLSLAASADIEVLLGPENEIGSAHLPERDPLLPHMIDVEPDRFYSSLSKLGYDYDGRFRSMVCLKRKHGKASCVVNCSPTDRRHDSRMVVHPAELDAAFQSLLLAYSYPGDDQLRSLHLPVRIGCIRVDPASSQISDHSSIHVDAAVVRPVGDAQLLARDGFSGDINIYMADSSQATIQVEDVRLVPLQGSSAKEQDRKMFSRMEWVNMMPDGQEAATAGDDSSICHTRTREIFNGLERLAAFYMRQFDEQIPEDSPLRSSSESGAIGHYLEYARQVVSSLPRQNPQWMNDTLADVLDATRQYEHLPDMGVMHLVGETMPGVFRGETTMLEKFRETDILDNYYVNGFASAPSGRWQTRVVSQIADRHPHLHMLEIGAGTGGTTKPILKALDSRFRSYTFTDVSAGFFGAAADALAAYQDRLIFKTLDIERDPISQGFVPQSYDVVIASFVLHATASLERTLTHARALLRPGGFLVVGEGSVNCGPSSFIFGPLPGWWLGRGDEGRTLTPHMSYDRWDLLLRKTGFAGIDTRAPVEWEDHLGVCLFSSQAVDPIISLLRSPLSHRGLEETKMINKLAVLGGKTHAVEGILVSLLKLLEPFTRETIVIRDLAGLSDVGLLSDHMGNPATVLSLTDLDKPVFQDMTEDEFASFRSIFAAERTVLWVTSGRRSASPLSNMVVGFSRTAVHETTGLRVQHVDIENPKAPEAIRAVAESLLRLQFHRTTGQNEEDSTKAGSVLWTAEPEIVIDSTGRQRVPRLRHLGCLNDRYNSARRPVLKDVDIGRNAVEVHLNRKGHVSLRGAVPGVVHSSKRGVQLAVTHGTLSAIRTPVGHQFLAIGKDTKTEATYLALLPSLSTVATISNPSAIRLSSRVASIKETTILSLVAVDLMASTILDSLYPGQTILVHSGNAVFNRSIEAHASKIGVRAAFVADAVLPDAKLKQCQLGPKVICLPPHMTESKMRKCLPPLDELSCFVTLVPSDGPSKAREMILASIAPWCRTETLERLLAPRSNLEGKNHNTTIMRQVLRQTVDNLGIFQHPCQSLSGFEIIEIGKLASQTGENKRRHPLTIVDLSTSPHLPVPVARLDCGRPLFKHERTYWLVGLSGALGVSLCDWMFASGARHIVLSSRNPQIDRLWVELHEREGNNVTIIPCDITDYTSLANVHGTISNSHPPIAGIFNGAMVLRDTSVRNMSFSQLNDVLRPKVLGSLNLDRLFSVDKPLDFFVLLSSINCVIGNQGQANYAAANTFQCALAASRRRRGLRGVAVNAGAIIGAGYIQRSAKRVLDLTVSRGAMMHLSEEDFHQLIAEAIAAEGDDQVGPELTTGLLDVARDSPERPVWFDDPKFCHLITTENLSSTKALERGLAATETLNPTSVSVVRKRLQECRSLKDITDVVTGAFAAQLRRELQMTAPSDEELMGMRSNEIGLDSLVSVDIRSWFLKTIGVSIPVLLIMANDTTMASLVNLAVEGVPAELTPLVSSVDITEEGSKERLKIPTQDMGQILEERLSGMSTPIRSTVSEADTLFTAVATTPDIDKDYIDWDEETSPAGPDSFEVNCSRRTPSTPPRTIVLTGATGLLGHHIVKYILDASPSTKVVCVAVRQAMEHTSRQYDDVLDDLVPGGQVKDRVSFYGGDLGLPNLGLSLEESASIFETADCVIHAGADTSHLKSYSSLRAANVASTRELARLCLRRRIPIHYVSSAGVGLFPTRGKEMFLGDMVELLPAKAPGMPPSSHRLVDLAGGYTASKWASERLLERTNQVHGLPVWIHRPSTIIREGIDAEGQKAELDWLNGLVKYAGLLGAVPEIKYLKGALDMVYVRNVCQTILQGVLESSRQGRVKEERRVTYVHEVGDIVVPLDNLESLVNLAEGFVRASEGDSGFSVLPMTEWVARAVDRGLHPAVAALIERMDGPGKPNYPRLRKGRSD